jgi:hypothetical protein
MSKAVQSRPTVHWLAPDQTAEWDAFVARHPLGLVYHLSAWTRVLETAFTHIQGRFLVLRDGVDGTIRAGLPVYTVQSWLLGRRVVSIPFASFSDPLISSVAEFDQLLPHLEELQRSTKSRLLEVRLTQTAAQLGSTRLVSSSDYKHHYLALDKDCDTLFESFAKTSIRQKIRKAINAGVTVEERTDEGCMEACHAILAETRMRRFLPAMPYAFFQAVGQAGSLPFGSEIQGSLDLRVFGRYGRRQVRRQSAAVLGDHSTGACRGRKDLQLWANLGVESRVVGVQETMGHGGRRYRRTHPADGAQIGSQEKPRNSPREFSRLPGGSVDCGQSSHPDLSPHRQLLLPPFGLSQFSSRAAGSAPSSR